MCAQVLQREGVLAYTSIEEGEITATRLAQLPDDVEADRVRFLQVHARPADQSIPHSKSHIA